MSVGTGTAIAIGAGAAAAGTVGSGLIQKGAAEDAAQAQAQATDKSIEFQKQEGERARQFIREQSNQARSDLQPFRDAQLSALGRLQASLDPNSQTTQLERQQATQAIQRTLAAQGLLRSRKQSDLLQDLELGLLRRRDSINQGILGLGAAQAQANIANATGSSLANLSQQLGQNIGTSFVQGGQAAAQGFLNSGSATAGIFSGLNNVAQGTLSNALLFGQLGGGNSGIPALGDTQRGPSQRLFDLNQSNAFSAANFGSGLGSFGSGPSLFR